MSENFFFQENILLYRQLQQGRRQRRRDAQRKQRETEKLKDEIIGWKRRYEKVKKRNIRLQRANLDSPEVKTQKVLQGQRVNTHVRKTLKYHFAVLGALKHKSKSFRATKSKQSLAQLVSEKVKFKTYSSSVVILKSSEKQSKFKARNWHTEGD